MATWSKRGGTILQLGETRLMWTKGGERHTMECIDQADNVWSEKANRNLNYRLLQSAEDGSRWAQSDATFVPWPASSTTLRMFGRGEEANTMALAEGEALRRNPPKRERAGSGDVAAVLARIEAKLDQLLARGAAPAPAAAEKPFPSYDPDAPPIYVPPFPIWDNPGVPHEHERDAD